MLAIGVGSILVGLFAILAPAVASISVTILVGWALVVGGAIQLVQVVRRGGYRQALWSIVTAVLAVIAGIWILVAPLTGAITLTVVLVAWFWAMGLVRLFGWWQARSLPGGWMLAVQGVIAIVLGALIWAELPSSATWAIGLLVGIELLVAGASFLAAALEGRRLARGVAIG
jgi:uncharacterized membrane protein HdeD (DUF308 family)